MSFFNSLKLLLPSGKAFDITQETKVRKFIRGLSVLPEDVKRENELVYMDLFPESTRAMEEWEKQFSVLFADLQYGDTRRGILKALWQVNIGGQDLKYLQAVLQNIDKKIKVFENVPIKNPRDANAVFGCMCGQRQSVCGNKKLCCGYKDGDSEFTPTVIRNDTDQLYDIPVDGLYWQNYFFVTKDVVRNSKNEIIYCQKLILDKKWKPFIEYLILKIKPVQMGALIFIQYEENYDETKNTRRR